ncbi:hypothetical protein L1887_29162 [Cichorium endivia]|nr:hypothetical protein L1887_29162 [Cichorium endivia]
MKELDGKVLIRLIGADGNLYTSFADSTQWLQESDVLEMIDCPQVHGNAAESLCAICRYAPPGLAAKISSPSFIARLFHHALGELRPMAVLVNALSEELEKEGIWDFDRLSKPYILQEFLQDKFGPSWIFVASHFMNESQKNHYEFNFNRQETLWRQNAMKTLLALLNSSDMLACGEDLGLIPSCVHPVCLHLSCL